jgi:uncharacterized membrane protein (DUF4010 family)
MDPDVFKRFLVALAIGGLIGLEREHSKRFAAKGPAEPPLPVDAPSLDFAGIRTFPLIALCGALAAYLTTWMGPAFFVAAFAAFTVLVTAAYHRIAGQGSDLGITTAVAALLVFGLSGLCLFAPLELCGALAVCIYLILTLKPPLRALARAVEPEDLYAIGKFGAISLLVVPLLPDRTYGPFDVLNPHQIGLLVVLIAAISLAGYLAVKALGSGRGFGLTGLLGGLVSSTAVTLSFSQKSREYPMLALPSALAIVLASTVMSPRVLVVIALLSSSLVASVWIPLACMTLASLAVCVALYRKTRTTEVGAHSVEFKNPFELGPAIKFASIFAIVLVGAKALEQALGNTGLYISGVVAGMPDVDAIVVSMARLHASGQVPASVAATVITLAVMSNTMTKALMALMLAGHGTRAWVFWALFGQVAAGGAAIAALYFV